MAGKAVTLFCDACRKWVVWESGVIWDTGKLYCVFVSWIQRITGGCCCKVWCLERCQQFPNNHLCFHRWCLSRKIPRHCFCFLRIPFGMPTSLFMSKLTVTSPFRSFVCVISRVWAESHEVGLPKCLVRGRSGFLKLKIHRVTALL